MNLVILLITQFVVFISVVGENVNQSMKLWHACFIWHERHLLLKECVTYEYWQCISRRWLFTPSLKLWLCSFGSWNTLSPKIWQFPHLLEGLEELALPIRKILFRCMKDCCSRVPWIFIWFLLFCVLTRVFKIWMAT